MYYHQPKITDISMLNSSLGGLQFGVDDDGNYGYIKAGADTVTPFKNGANIEIINKSITVTKNMIPLYMANGRYGISGALYRSSLNGVSPIPNNKVRLISGSDSDGYGYTICELLVKEGDILSVSSYRDGDNVIAY